MLHANNRLHGDSKVNTIVFEVAARHRDDVLAQPPDQDYNRDRRHTAYRQYILW
jgi:hypothetical protein